MQYDRGVLRGRVDLHIGWCGIARTGHDPPLLLLDGHLLDDDRFTNALWVSFEFVATAVAVEFVFGFALAFLFNAKLPGLATIRNIAILPIMVMPLASGLVWFYMLNENFGAVNWIAVLLGAPQRR